MVRDINNSCGENDNDEAVVDEINVDYGVDDSNCRT